MLQLEFNFFVFAFPITKHYYCLVVSVTPIDSIDWLLILLWLCFRLKDSPTFDSYQHKPLDKIFEPFLFDVFATDKWFIQTNTVVLIASDIYKFPWKTTGTYSPMIWSLTDVMGSLYLRWKQIQNNFMHGTDNFYGYFHRPFKASFQLAQTRDVCLKIMANMSFSERNYLK